MVNACAIDEAGKHPADAKNVEHVFSLTPRMKTLVLIIGMVMVGFALASPVSAAELNLSFVGEMFTSLFTALTDCVVPFESFVDAGFPVLIKVIVYVAVIGVIGLALYTFRSFVEKIISMIGFR